MPEIIYLLDGHALAYRTYFALTGGSGSAARWVTSSGESTAGVYGFTAVLLRILEQENPDYIAVAFDTGKTFRHTTYEAYKGTRAKMPEDLRPQIERMREMVDAFNIPRIEVDNYEADDVLGSLAIWAAEKKGLAVKIITGDRDLLQLVSPRIVVSLPGKKLSDSEDFFPENVFEKYGIYPNQVVDYKALVGDTSDNIPGVRGIGEKTATTLLSEYKTLDNIYLNIENLSPRISKILSEGKENAYLSQYLARIVTDLDLDLDLENSKSNRFNPTKVEDLFKVLEFRTLTQRLKAVVKKIQPISSTSGQLSLFNSTDTIQVETKKIGVDNIIVDTPEKLLQCVEAINGSKIVSFDTETTDTDTMKADLVGISLAVNDKSGYYIPLGHKDGKQLTQEQVRNGLKESFQNPMIQKVAHNAKFDLIMLKRFGLEVTPISFDTMIAEWIIRPDSRNLGLKDLAQIRLDVEMTHIESLIGKGNNQRSMADIPIAKVADYATADAIMTLRLFRSIKDDLQAHNGIEVLHKYEIPLIPILAEMEMTGIKLDSKYMQALSNELGERLFLIEKDIFSMAGTNFNLNSTQQLSNILFNKLKLEPPDRSKKTSSGLLSTAASVLEDMKDQHQIISLILEYRELTKLKSTYVDTLPLQINPISGRIHTSFNQTGTVTGRIASSNPNLQNIPTRTEIGRKVRNGFVSQVNHQLLAVDYSQIELRIVAHMAKDDRMLEAFHQGQDIHSTTAAAIYRKPLENITKQERRHAKAINFGLIYGMSPYGLTRTTELTLAEAEDFVKAYFEQFPGIKAWLDNTRIEAAEKGYVETLSGRRRYFPNLKSGTNAITKQREEREAINAPIQGTAADIMKLAMVNIPPALAKEKLSGKMLLQVHDEVILEVPDSELNTTIEIVKNTMENAFKLSIPLKTDARFGKNWGELESIE